MLKSNRFISLSRKTQTSNSEQNIRQSRCSQDDVGPVETTCRCRNSQQSRAVNSFQHIEEVTSNRGSKQGQTEHSSRGSAESSDREYSVYLSMKGDGNTKVFSYTGYFY